MGKGSDFERIIAKELSLWWDQESNCPRDDIFYRTHASGARHTSRAKRDKTTANAAGDLMYVDDSGKPFIDKVLVEIKRGYTSVGRISTVGIESVVKKSISSSKPLPNLLRKYIASKLKKGGDVIDPLDFIDSDKNVPVLFKWWEKAEKERIEADRIWSMIIFQRDGKKRSILMGVDLYNEIVDFSGGDTFSKCLDISLYDKPEPLQTMIIVSFDEFINGADPDLFGRSE